VGSMLLASLTTSYRKVSGTITSVSTTTIPSHQASPGLKLEKFSGTPLMGTIGRRAYYFVAPRGIGTTLTQYLANATALKAELLKSWDKRVRDKITAKQTVALEGKFADYVHTFDFSIFKPMSVREVVEQHRTSPYFIPRFGGGLPARPKPAVPPDEIQAHESIYVGKLLDAYADHTKAIVPDIGTLKKWSRLDRHFKRQREAFFHAESLRVFVRDKVEPGTFESLQDEIYHGVANGTLSPSTTLSICLSSSKTSSVSLCTLSAEAARSPPQTIEAIRTGRAVWRNLSAARHSERTFPSRRSYVSPLRHHTA
jgi:C-terminal domain 6 of the ABC-three component (ABC-3C) systems